MQILAYILIIGYLRSSKIKKIRNFKDKQKVYTIFGKQFQNLCIHFSFDVSKISVHLHLKTMGKGVSDIFSLTKCILLVLRFKYYEHLLGLKIKLKVRNTDMLNLENNLVFGYLCTSKQLKK